MVFDSFSIEAVVGCVIFYLGNPYINSTNAYQNLTEILEMVYTAKTAQNVIKLKLTRLKLTELNFN